MATSKLKRLMGTAGLILIVFKGIGLPPMTVAFDNVVGELGSELLEPPVAAAPPTEKLAVRALRVVT